VCAGAGCTPVVTNYVYDNANRLTSVNGVAQTWDNNGNLLNDGASTYTYDAANRLKTVTQGANAYSYVYNGLGDRLSQTVNGVTTQYTLDLNTGLTQVLADGTSTYLYGPTRLGEKQSAGFVYHLPDALGSVRQVTNSTGIVTLTRNYDPYGNVLNTSGTGITSYGYTGEWTDGTGLAHLRSRYYAPGVGRFTSRDTFTGDYNRPITLNKWAYAYANPINYTDPTGKDPGLIALCLAAVALPLDGPVLDLAACGALAVEALFVAGTLTYLASRPACQFPSGFTLHDVPPSVTADEWPTVQVPHYLPGPRLEERPLNPLIFVLENLEPFIESFPLDSGVPPILHTSPFPGQQLQGPTMWMVTTADIATRLQVALGPGQQGRVTMAVGVGEIGGERILLIGTSESNGYIRPSVRPIIVALGLDYNVKVVSGTGHAEENIVNYASSNGVDLLEVSAGRPICHNCEDLIRGAGATPGSVTLRELGR
jgi:RHS repeat-associated protein